MTGIDRNNEMRTLSSVPQQTRQALADRYGTEWLEDFEEWAKRPFGRKRRFDTVLRRPFDLGIIQAYPHSLRGLHA